MIPCEMGRFVIPADGSLELCPAAAVFIVRLAPLDTTLLLCGEHFTTLRAAGTPHERQLNSLYSARFGEVWDSPRGIELTEVNAPVGSRCLHCNDHIELGDRGVVMVAARMEGATLEPLHLECDLRMAVGSLAHLEGRCSCHGYLEEPLSGDLHEEARQVLAWVIQKWRMGKPL